MFPDVVENMTGRGDEQVLLAPEPGEVEFCCIVEVLDHERRILQDTLPVLSGLPGEISTERNEAPVVVIVSWTERFPGSVPHIRTRLYVHSFSLFRAFTGEKARSIRNPPSCTRADNNTRGNGWEFSINRIDDKNLHDRKGTRLMI